MMLLFSFSKDQRFYNSMLTNCISKRGLHHVNCLSQQLFEVTPLKRSLENRRVLFKLDNLQPSGSFKDRGISNMIKVLSENSLVSKLICSSGGNAGNAVATCAEKLKIAADVFVPLTTLPMMVEKLKNRGANVVVGGANWNEADSEAKKALAKDSNAHYIPPFDHPLIWEGNSSIVDELVSQLDGIAPDAIVLSVGGGGLLRGVQLGLERYPEWHKVRILAVETEGAASFALAKSDGKDVALSKISTVASSLGALKVTASVLDTIIRTDSVVVSDADAVAGCLSFASECRQIVEPACGAALSVIYNPKYEHLIEGMEKVVVIVCGGSAVSLDLLNTWKGDYR